MPQPRPVSADDLFPVVHTTHGAVRGLRMAGVHTFKGLPYGADTAGPHRFQPARPPEPWGGVRDATRYGAHAPQLPASRLHAYADLILYDQQPGGMGEDCLVVNVWTPTLDADARRPVLVHLHGGGSYAGSGNSPQFDGEMLARFGNAVVVTLNHRLGAFGFLDLSSVGGERYAASGVVGMLDIVAALAWVRDNIAMFGGDPARVLVFGQSGGGAKAGTLMAMPPARGLFHRAGVMSGSALRLVPRETAARVTHAFLTALGIGSRDLDRLHTVPFEALLAAQVQLEMVDRRQGEAPRAFAPVVGSAALPHHPFDPVAPEMSRDVPLVIGTTLDERAYRMVDFDLDEAGFRAFASTAAAAASDSVAASAANATDADGAALAAMYRDEDPSATPFLLKARLDTDRSFRHSAHRQAERQAALGGAPVYSYLWTAPSPAWGGRYGAVHGVDIGPSLHDIRHGLNGPHDDQLRLADQLASAWVAFAATGSPQSAHVPDWPAWTPERRATLAFQRDGAGPVVRDDPRAAFRQWWAQRLG